MTDNVIRIHLSTELPTRAQNALRYAIELGIWSAAWRKAEAAEDYAAMDRLDRAFETVGLP